MIQKRMGLFETNSSSTHSITIHLWDTYVTVYIDPGDDSNEVVLDELDEGWILANIPTKELEAKLKNRKDNEANV